MTGPLDPRAVELIQRLRLTPHPEGGYYRELFRSDSVVRPADGRPPRSALTTIYFLLAAGAHSRWHRVTSDEVWHVYEGSPLELLLASPALDQVERIVLGPATPIHEPVRAVPAGWWQAARPQGAYVLAGCSVAPGFDFADFNFLRDDAVALARLSRLSRELARLA
jgi:predicted cupin superfamily sugar epimerase